MNLLNLIRIKLGLRDRRTGLPSVKFHHDANYFGEHGRIVVSHHRLGLVEQPVIFAFPGMSIPPALTPFFLQYLWDEAADQGYIPHYLQSYGSSAVRLMNLSGMTVTEAAEEQRYGVSEVMSSDEVTVPTVLDGPAQLTTDRTLQPFRTKQRAPSAVHEDLQAMGGRR